MIYGYARVSTAGQALNGTSLEEQERALKEAGAIEVYREAYTGTTTDRPEFTALLDKLKSGDRLVVTKLDRFSRTATEGYIIIQDLLSKGIAVHVLNMGLMDSSPTGRLITHILLAFAEFERDMIYERTQTGKARKREAGTLKEGRPPLQIDSLDKYVQMVEKKEISVSEACRKLGITRPTWYARLKKKEKEQAN